MPLILRIGEALALAHSQGMIHRDIKPANILLDEHGAAKLTDFDLVGAHDTTGGTRTGALGTVVYAAPECLDRPQEATARADVYGLGMTTIFCLAGQDLSMDTFRNPQWTIDRLRCSIQVQAVLRWAVAWEPHERFADAAALGLKLREALDLGQMAVLDVCGARRGFRSHSDNTDRATYTPIHARIEYRNQPQWETSPRFSQRR